MKKSNTAQRQGQDEALAANTMPTVDCDREVWVKERIRTAMNMALAVQKCAKVRAEELTLESALEGIANGCAVEVIHTLGMRPGYKNLRKVVG